MKYFQTLSFIVEILLLTGICAIFLMLALNIIKDEKSWLKSPKLYLRVIDLLGRVFLLFLAGYLFIYGLLPHVIDVPRLVTGNYEYIEGFANITDDSGDPFTYVDIEGVEGEFFMGSGIKEGEYRMAYLPNSHRGIFLENTNISQSNENRLVKVPKSAIFIILYVVFVFGFLNRFAYWIFGFASIVFYSVSLYFYINYGRTMGIWFSLKNEGLVSILSGLSILLIFILGYLLISHISKRKSRRDPYNYDEFQQENLTIYIAHIIAGAYWVFSLSLLNII